jgi:hypothetical protein
MAERGLEMLNVDGVSLKAIPSGSRHWLRRTSFRRDERIK